MLKAINVPEYWQKPLIVLFLFLCVFVGLFAQSWLSIVSIWERSDTYAHGFFVIPASLWLIWSQRQLLKNTQPYPSFWALIFLLGSGFGWLVAVLSKVLVVEQFALVAMLISLVWAVLGNQVSIKILFPLMFLFLMVPFGEDFVPYLMEYTATFVVGMIRFTGMSVYREGLHFTLTSGQWSVVEACSGIRYLIASFTLGLIYAYINYISNLKRTLFILLSVLVPILANGLRAYMIVMIGHLSGMKLATGVDHIIYGWLFFGLVMMLLFYVGSFWSDAPNTAVEELTNEKVSNATSLRLLAMACGLVLCCIGIWPIAASELQNKQMVQASIPEAVLLKLPPAALDPDWGWKPGFVGVQAESLHFVDLDDQAVGIYFANFGDESQGGELINSQNTLIPSKDKRWRIVDSDVGPLALSEQMISMEQSVLTDKQLRLQILRWYRIGGKNTANRYYAKWLQLLKRLTGDARPELMVVLYTKMADERDSQAKQRLLKVATRCCA